MFKDLWKFLTIPILVVVGYLAWWYHTWLLNRRVDEVISRTKKEIDRLISEHKATLKRVSSEHKAELEAAHKARIEEYEANLRGIEEERTKFKGVSRQRLAEYINDIKKR